MLDFSKYSRTAFESAGINSEAARVLADELAQDVLVALDTVIRSELARIVGGLNAHGHALTSYGDLEAGEYSFRDEQVPRACRLRLACDVVISTGYAHTHEPDGEDAA